MTQPRAPRNRSIPESVIMPVLVYADVDAHYRRAEAAGARIVATPVDHVYGERQYTAEDLAGHRWTFSQTIADVDPASWGGVLVE